MRLVAVGLLQEAKNKNKFLGKIRSATEHIRCLMDPHKLEVEAEYAQVNPLDQSIFRGILDSSEVGITGEYKESTFEPILTNKVIYVPQLTKKLTHEELQEFTVGKELNFIKHSCC